MRISDFLRLYIYFFRKNIKIVLLFNIISLIVFLFFGVMYQTSMSIKSNVNDKIESIVRKEDIEISTLKKVNNNFYSVLEEYEGCYSYVLSEYKGICYYNFDYSKNYDFELLTGVLPLEKNEIIISNDYEDNIGDKIYFNDNEYLVVGKYSSLNREEPISSFYSLLSLDPEIYSVSIYYQYDSSYNISISRITKLYNNIAEYEAKSSLLDLYIISNNQANKIKTSFMLMAYLLLIIYLIIFVLEIKISFISLSRYTNMYELLGLKPRLKYIFSMFNSIMYLIIGFIFFIAIFIISKEFIANSILNILKGLDNSIFNSYNDYRYQISISFLPFLIIMCFIIVAVIISNIIIYLINRKKNFSIQKINSE